MSYNSRPNVHNSKNKVTLKKAEAVQPNIMNLRLEQKQHRCASIYKKIFKKKAYLIAHPHQNV